MLWVHFFVEEQSAEAALINLVPKILQDIPADDWDFEIYIFQIYMNDVFRIAER